MFRCVLFNTELTPKVQFYWLQSLNRKQAQSTDNAMRDKWKCWMWKRKSSLNISYFIERNIYTLRNTGFKETLQDLPKIRLTGMDRCSYKRGWLSLSDSLHSCYRIYSRILSCYIATTPSTPTRLLRISFWLRRHLLQLKHTETRIWIIINSSVLHQAIYIAWDLFRILLSNDFPKIMDNNKSNVPN